MFQLHASYTLEFVCCSDQSAACQHNKYIVYGFTEFYLLVLEEERFYHFIIFGLVYKVCNRNFMKIKITSMMEIEFRIKVDIIVHRKQYSGTKQRFFL